MVAIDFSILSIRWGLPTDFQSGEHVHALIDYAVKISHMLLHDYMTCGPCYGCQHGLKQ